MIHLITCASYQRGRQYAQEQGLNPRECAIVWEDEHYMKISGVSREPGVVELHDLVYIGPGMDSMLRSKGLRR